MEYLDPDTHITFRDAPIRKNTEEALAFYQFTDDSNTVIEWTQGQKEIIDCILNRSAPDNITKRVQIKASTQYGKSLAVAAGVAIRSSIFPEKWSIIAGTTEKARIIMEYVIMLTLNNKILRTQLTADTSLDRLRMKKSADWLTFRRKGEVRVYSSEAGLVAETSKALMGFGSPNVIQDEAALSPDDLQATILRMLGGYKDNFLVKIGNPFNRGHFLRTWMDGKYYRIFIDYHRALHEGRYSASFIEEMKLEAMFDILYECRSPLEGMIDSQGWMQLLTEDDLKRSFVEAEPPFGIFRLGNDVAGGGRNFSCTVLRAYNTASILMRENLRDTMKLVGRVMAYTIQLEVRKDEIYTDEVGVGRGASDRLHELGNEKEGYPVGVNAGSEPDDKTRFTNKRAEMYWRAREWILRGGKLEKNDLWYELTKIKWKAADSSGKIKIMPKEEMLKHGIESPDVADALSLTFYKADNYPVHTQQQVQIEVRAPSLDPYGR